MDKKSLSEQDICSKFILPAVTKAGWDLHSQIREQVTFTAGQIFVRGEMVTRGEKKRADFILYYKNNLPIAIIEAKDNNHRPSDGIQQGLSYAEALDIPFVYSSNGDEFFEHDKTKTEGEIERSINLENFPSPEELYNRYKIAKGITEPKEQIILQDYYAGLTSSEPRYYQQVAVNRTVSAIADGQKRVLLVMATGTGKTYTAFQIIYRLWKSRTKKRILFLVDRTALAAQTMQGDFRHFGDKMTKIEKKIADPSYEVFVALYQGLTSAEEENKLFKQFSPDFFDLIVVDECHRGSAKENSVWREILDYYSSATQIGLTATPKETTDISTEEYFGKPVYTYSLKQGIRDGYLAPYKVTRFILDKDIEWRPEPGVKDQHGNNIEDRFYNVSDYDRNIVVKARTKLVAQKITEFMKETDPMQKAIIFCVDIDHAERMRQELVNLNPEMVSQNHRYVVRITGDNEEGKKEIENLINPESPYPVLVTTSKLLTTGIDAQTCKLIVLDSSINSMTEFKQIIGRGTRVNEQYGKYYFNILDFRGVTRLFADPDFDGEPVKIYEPEGPQHVTPPSEPQPPLEPGETILIDPGEPPEPKEKIVISEGVSFDVATKTIQYIDPLTGKLIIENLIDFSKKKMLDSYSSLEDFINRWNQTEKKEAVIKELEEKGVIFSEIQKEVGLNIDEFDLILHLAFNKKPLTRSERVESIRKKDHFTKYEGKAREVLESLLDKYAEHGSLSIDSIEDLKVSPFTDIGTPVEIVNDFFGGKENYLEAISALQAELYTLN
ncbi:MAG: type restriction enzyme subunit [Patescibacteria group bacterium]|nr:type restriction enzyme subunit [Patescibacteria group bacterium]